MSTKGVNDFEQSGENNGQVMYDNRNESVSQHLDEQLKEQLREQLGQHVEEHLHQHLDKHLQAQLNSDEKDQMMTDNIYEERDENTGQYTYTFTDRQENPSNQNHYHMNRNDMNRNDMDRNDMNRNNYEQNNYEQNKTIDENNFQSKDKDTNVLDFPRQVMTALGPLPLPEEFKNNIPEKFVAKPIIEEREIYVSKKERKQREVEIPHVQYEHTFKNVKKQFRVSKLIPTVSEVVKEIPKEVLKPVIEEKIIEVPQGVKYVEVPVEVPCLYPPRIVPRVVTQYVERIVETIKPIVQEKIIEVPQTVIKQVPKIKTVEVPYYVPRYVEKIVEVPFKPNGERMPQIGSHFPFSVSDALPPLKPTHILNKPSSYNMNVPYMQQQNNQLYSSQQFNDMMKYMQRSNNANQNNMPNIGSTLKMQQPSMVEQQMNTGLDGHGSFLFNSNSLSVNGHRNSINDMHYQHMFNHNMSMPMSIPVNSSIKSNSNAGMYNVDHTNRKENLAEQIENLQKMHNLPDGMQWGYPDGVNKPLMSNTQMAPLVVTCPPEIGKVTCARKDIQPDILTKTGVYEFEGFKKKGTAQALFPPLAPHHGVPFLPPPAAAGTPDVRTLEKSL